MYPVARGTGPLFAITAAVVLLGERPGLPGSAGIAAILAGILLVSGLVAAAGRKLPAAGAGWGALTGLWITGYTVVDAWAVTRLRLDPVVFFSLSLLVSTLVLAPFALREPASHVSLPVPTRSSSSRCGRLHSRLSPLCARCR